MDENSGSGKISIRLGDIHQGILSYEYYTSRGCIGMYRMYSILPLLKYGYESWKTEEKEAISYEPRLVQFVGYAVYEDLKVERIEGVVYKGVSFSPKGIRVHEESFEGLLWHRENLGWKKDPRNLFWDTFYLGSDWRHSYSLNVLSVANWKAIPLFFPCGNIVKALRFEANY